MISQHKLVNLVQLSYIIHIVYLKCNNLDLLQEFNFSEISVLSLN